jgi:hypothetical protein
MKLSEYAKQQGISYRTAFRWWQAGQIPGYQAATGTIIVHDPKPFPLPRSALPSMRASLPMNIRPTWTGKRNGCFPIAPPKAIR